MKKTLFTLLFGLIATIGFAQTDHLAFMGIPLNGTIDQFQNKLSAKGVYVDHTINRSVGIGTRAFKGSFSGRKATIYAYYNEKTKVVYRAKAVISTTESDICKTDYDYYVDMLTRKYYFAETEKGTKDGYESTSFLIPTLDESSFYKYLGSIGVYRTSYNYGYYDLHVDYTDTVNTLKNDRKNMDDL